jgi:hypothetical protein
MNKGGTPFKLGGPQQGPGPRGMMPNRPMMGGRNNPKKEFFFDVISQLDEQLAELDAKLRHSRKPFLVRKLTELLNNLQGRAYYMECF